MIIGGCLFVMDLLLYLFHDKLKWLGHLPGDISIEREHFRFYFPITTMIIISVILTLLVNLIRRFL
ncbi:MAG: DUF2905 domain-containing protein [Bacteroidota bacterium]